MTNWELNSQQMQSFVGWNPQFETVNGPATFWSFSQDKTRPAGGPMFWMEKETIVNCIVKARQEDDFDSFHEFIRQGVALREDWRNNLMWAFELKLMPGDFVDAWVGLAKAQQTAIKAGRLQQRAKAGLSLVFWGGARQYLINQNEPAVRSMISLPCLTDTLFKSEKLPNTLIEGSNVKFTFNIRDGVNTRQVHQSELNEHAETNGLKRIVKNRYSSLFVFNLMLLGQASGFDPLQVIAEIKSLESLGPYLRTPKASEFKSSNLKGLWHKHFMLTPPSVIEHNIITYLEKKDGLKNIVEETLGPANNPSVTKDIIEEVSHRIIIGAMEKRAESEKLTGESMIVYAKENNINHYLGIWRHDAGDAKIAETIKSTCVPQFPFLGKYFP